MTKGTKQKLHGVRGRLRIQIMLNWATKGLVLGTLAAALLMVLSKFTALDIDLVRTGASLLVAGAAIGSITALILPITLFDAAFACDTHLGLRERLTSALEFAGEQSTNPLVPALIADAARHANRIKPGRDFPLRLPRELLYALILVAITAGLYFVPPWQYVFASEEKKEELAEIKAEAECVREIAREITINPPAERSEFAEEIARELQELARDMDFGTLSRREALERLSKIEESIEQNQEESGYNELRERLDQLAEALARNENLRQAAQSLSEGDAQRARETLEKLAEDLESGRVPAESFQQLAEALDKAAGSLEENPDMAGLRDSLAQARDELRAAAQAARMGAEMDPVEMAKQLIDAINKSIPEIGDLDIPQEVKDRATEALESVREQLQQALDRGDVSKQDIDRAMQRLEEVRKMLEEAGIDFGDQAQDERTDEEIAQELLEEAERLQNQSSKMSELDPQTRSQCQSTCQSVSSDLQNRLNQGTCSAQSNAEARRKLDEVRQQLEQAGAEEEDLGNRASCSNPSSCQSGQQGGKQGKSCGSGMQGLFGMRQSGNQGQGSKPGQGQGSPSSRCQGAGRALRSAGQCLGKFGSQLQSGQCMSKAQRSLGACKGGLGGCRGRPSSGSQCQGARAAGGWGTSSTPYAVAPSPIDPGHKNDPSLDPNNTNAEKRDYQALYEPYFEQSSGYDVQLEGKFTDAGGSYVFIEVADPETGETSYVPYFDLEPTDITALMDAVEDQDIPRSYEDFVRFYFEQLTGATTSAK